jgi:hypothetical protein
MKKYALIKSVKGANCDHVPVGSRIISYTNINDAYRDKNDNNRIYAAECGCQVEVKEVETE